MVRLKCPSCAAVIDVPAGTAPVCPSCGFKGRAPSAPAGAGKPAPAARPAPGLSPLPAPSPFSAPPVQAPLPRPGWVTFAAVMQFIGAGALILAGLILAIMGPFVADAIAEDPEVNPEFADLGGALLAVVGVIAILFGVLALVLGIYLLKGRQWARILTLVFAFIGGILGLLSLVLGDPSSLLGTVLNTLVIVGLLLPVSRQWFEQQSRPAA